MISESDKRGVATDSDSVSISIITPSYNQVEYLQRTLESVKTQSYDAVEHIVVDGGSTDGTVDLLESYESRYNLTWISEPDRGQSHAVNKGLKMATGDWVGWQNSDDFYLPEAFQAVVDAIETNPDAIAVYGDLLIVNEEGKELSRQFMIPPSKFVQRYWSLFTSNQSLFVRADVFRQFGGLDESYDLAMDADLAWNLINHEGDIFHIPELLGAFRIQSDAKTFADVSDQQQAELDRIYDHPWYEGVVPRGVLNRLAQGVKLWYLCRIDRWDALAYNFDARFP